MGGEIAYVSWPNDGAVPLSHRDIVTVLQTIGARSIADTLLAFLKFLEEPEIARNCHRSFSVLFMGRIE